MTVGVGLAGSQGGAQDLSTMVFPSETELEEALRLDEIDSVRFAMLREIFLHGVCPSGSHLVDEIPNLTYVLDSPLACPTALQKEQQTPFESPAATHRLRYRVRHACFCGIYRDSHTRYRTSLHLYPRPGLELQVKLERDRLGRRRLKGRTIRLKSRRSAVRMLVLGNFTARLGLGTIWGYRGELIESPAGLGGASWLTPSYGGVNGLMARIESGRTRVSTIASYHRNESYWLASVGGAVGRSLGRLRGDIILAGSRLVNRENEGCYDDLKIAFSGSHRYAQGQVSAEYCRQVARGRPGAAFLIEGSHRRLQTEVAYAGWLYTDGFVNLTGGGKTGVLGKTDTLIEADFPYRDRRSGQRGGTLRTNVAVGREFRLVNSGVYSGWDRGNGNWQILSGIVKDLGSGAQLRFDLLHKVTRRRRSRTVLESSRRTTRFEARTGRGPLAFRGYIAYHAPSAESEYWAAFVSVKYESVQLGRTELWSNMGRIDLTPVSLDYWYVFLRTEHLIIDGFRVGFKLSYSYRRKAADNRDATAAVDFGLDI